MRILCIHRVKADRRYLPGEIIPEIDKKSALLLESTGAGQILPDPPDGGEDPMEVIETPKTQEQEDQGDSMPDIGNPEERVQVEISETELNKIRVPDLKILAKGMGLKFPANIRKDDLIRLIQKAND